MTKEKLFKENINIAHKNVQKFRHCGIDRGDLLQICYLGLWKSVLNFQEEKGCKFSSYAYKVIQNEILQYLRKTKDINSIDFFRGNRRKYYTKGYFCR